MELGGKNCMDNSNVPNTGACIVLTHDTGARGLPGLKFAGPYSVLRHGCQRVLTLACSQEFIRLVCL